MKVDREGASILETRCWHWTAAKDIHGYPTFGIAYERVLASRFIFEAAHGKLEKGLLVCHRCDNPECVNPEHLWVGTDGDNIRDAQKKGRLGWNFKRYSPELSEEIRSAFASGTSRADLCIKYKVHRRTLKDILEKRRKKDRLLERR